MPRVFVAFDTCCSGANRYQITRRLVAQRVAPAARVILSQTPKLSAMEVVDGNDGALAAGIAVAATMQLFVCTCFNLSSSCDIGEPGRGSAPLSFLGS